MELENKYGGAILMDLTRAFDTINQDLFIAKLHIFLFSKESLKLIKSYLTNRWQKTKLNTGFSKWTDILLRVLQEFVLGLVLFNSCIKGLFFLTENTNLYVLVMSRTRFFHLKTQMFVTMQTSEHFMYVIQICTV